jgi:hypothetical protein
MAELFKQFSWVIVMVLTRIVLLALSAALLLSTWFAMKYYKDTARIPSPMMRRFLYASLASSIILLVMAGFQFLFALIVAVTLTPIIMWYLRTETDPMVKLRRIYDKLPIPDLSA